MSEANIQGAGSRDVGSSTDPGSSNRRPAAAGQAPIRDRPMGPPKRGAIIKNIIADISKSLSSNSSSA